MIPTTPWGKISEGAPQELWPQNIPDGLHGYSIYTTGPCATGATAGHYENSYMDKYGSAQEAVRLMATQSGGHIYHLTEYPAYQSIAATGEHKVGRRMASQFSFLSSVGCAQPAHTGM